jgi:methylase of polypeptide subunit release factors
MAPDNPIWVTFGRSMVPFTAAAAAGVAAQVTAWTTKPRKVLDIAAGGGMFGILIAKAVPDANITALDWENVLEVTRENAAREGVAARYDCCR